MSGAALRRRARQRAAAVLDPVARAAYRLRHRGRTHRDVWERSIDHELDFWRAYAREHREDLLWRNEPTGPGPLDRPFWDVVAQHPATELAVLDVGAGPLTPLAKEVPGKRIAVTAVDALADGYATILAEAGIEPRVPTQPGHGERLLDQFTAGSFDIAYSGNALDHAYDPVLVIRNMLALLKEGGCVVLRHHRNEGQQALYRGLHQWNFDLRGEDLVIWNHEGEQNVTELLAAEAEVRSWLVRGEVWSVITPA